MIVSEIEVDTPEEWLIVLKDIETKVEALNKLINKNIAWEVRSGMIKNKWYIEVIAHEEDKKDL